MKYINNQEGTALVTALSLGLVSTIFVMALWFFVRQETGSISDVTYYTSERKNAQGIAEYIMTELQSNTLKCDGKLGPCYKSCISGDCVIDLPKPLCEAIGKTDCSTVSAIYRGFTEQTESQIAVTGPYAGSQLTKTTMLQSFTVTSSNEKSLHTNAPEKAIIDIVYKTIDEPDGWQ